ncbi:MULTISPECIES: cation:proton antiporter [Parasedimentitalea]|uniref:Sodium:proton antiporter n=2 Tax=Parasedimentitalea TaxID=2738399 RepID=A0A6L6WMB2_9RHOB|nr:MULTISPECIES: sodium:proton antiporter [Zongyanglinia]KAE9625903.1 sodium:proton antiporter [Zongyanglinia marina]MVO18460.1 sodium:proton antiporter [Zongyanglinia huanghaiensis]
MDLLQIASILIVLAALFGVLNYHFLKLPQAIGILVVALLASLGILGFDTLFPALQIGDEVRKIVGEFEFSEALLEGMLGLLLFAGALHVSISELRSQAGVVFLMATLGVALSTAIVGFGFSWITGMPLLVAMVFGALISPTDPVAVLGVLREANLRKSLETKIAGESLFNDGVAYVIYLVLVAMAFPVVGSHVTEVSDGAILFVQEALGGAAMGAALGWGTFQIMKRIDDYALEVLITLALAFGGYILSIYLHISAPIMAVVAGLFIGHVGMRDGMSEETRGYVDAFWKLVDEILNAILFVMIGFEIFVITDDYLLQGIYAIALALFGRLAAVAVPSVMMSGPGVIKGDIIPLMTWGGLKGGISIALALALPDSEWKPMILSVTYMVVIFSILIQGLTIAPMARKMARG